ncbi:MAG: DNA repair protein RadA [Bacteroidales bacterium]|jgi:DNA repair protein RadA/Sms
MAKNKTYYVCSDCGYESLKWLGKCPSCNEWNTFKTFTVKEDNINPFKNTLTQNEPVSINNIENTDDEVRYLVDDNEFNRVLGGGIVKGSIILVGGEPGIGKSTLMLQIALQFGNLKVLYVSGEESKSQIKLRYDRVKTSDKNNVLILNETDIDAIFKQVEDVDPDLLITDSIQTIYNTSLEASPGSVLQVRDCTMQFQKFAKTKQIPVILIGHITKDGNIAGPKILEHIVDVVIMFEGERNYGYRILRTVKNRFGPSSEIGMYLMHEKGLQQVNNPSEILLTKNTEDLSGIAIGVTIEGVRAVMIEIQALVSTAAYGTPQRMTSGFDVKRLNMLLAVLEKRCEFKLSAKDVFLNITGGLKIDDPAIDLAVVASVLSSNIDITIDKTICFAAEVGLSGEVRPVSHIEKRINEAEKLGFKDIIVSGFGLEKLNLKKHSINILGMNRIDEVFRYLFG